MTQSSPAHHSPIPAPDSTNPAPDAPRHSPLHERHEALGAKLADFGGWLMPIEYAGHGVLAEHAAVRQAVGVFDVSHLGKVSVHGAGAVAAVNACCTNDLSRLRPGQAQYTLCCDDATGGVVDDLIAYLRREDEVLLMPNAANAAEVIARLRAVAAVQSPAPEVTDLHEQLAVLAVQGPRSPDLLDRLGLPTRHAFMSFVDAQWQGRSVVVCRSGYTGERGYELVADAEDAGALWDALLATGVDLDVRPCGLGARDTLRIEMGLPLHGQDLTPEVTPLQGRCGWAVAWSKPEFAGRAALAREKETGPRRRLRGLRALGRGIPRPGMIVLDATDGQELGVVTSGTFSPTLRIGIGLALLDPAVAEGDDVTVDVRGRASPMQVVRPPFVETSPS